MLASVFFFFNDTATTEIYTLSLHDALPICPPVLTRAGWRCSSPCSRSARDCPLASSMSFSTSSAACGCRSRPRSEEHTSELQSLRHLVCRLLLEKKKKN